MAQRFEAGKLQLMGEPLSLAEKVGYNPALSYAAYSVSDNGLLTTSRGMGSANSQLAWFDRGGKQLETVGEPASQIRAAISPDEKHVVVDRADPQTGTFDLWIIELARRITTRFTFDPSIDWHPVWSPDGARIVFTSDRDGVFELYEKSSSGAGKEELLLKSGLPKQPTDWSLDGRFLLYHQLDPKTNFDLWVLPLTGEKKPIPFLRTEFVERDASFSPDGRWIAYTSDESGKEEIYVQAFPASGSKRQISKGGGTRARWRQDGKELFYISADRNLMAVEVSAGATFRAGVAQPLFETGISSPFARFAVTANGQRFLVPAPIAAEASSSPATVVIDWTRGIKQ